VVTRRRTKRSADWRLAERAFADLVTITLDDLIERQEHRIGHGYQYVSLALSDSFFQ
jgi:hypothetical protein